MARKLPVNDVVVLLPGITGSVLERQGKPVWAIEPGAVWRGVVSLGKAIKQLELDGDSPDAPVLDDGVRATRLVGDVHLIPGFWKIDGYGKIKKHLFDRFAFEDGVNWFDFPYDWRRDNRAAAHRLAEASIGWLDNWRARPGNEDAKLILVAHSMGGLVSRYFLEALGGWEQARALVTFGTPYRGSLNAVDQLANGSKKGFGPFKVDLSDTLRSFNSIYQLLPTYKCVVDGGTLCKVADAAGLPGGVDRAKVKDAVGFHDEIAKAVDDNGGYGRYAIHPLVGIFQPTSQSATVSGDGVTLAESLEGTDDSGDGTVPRVSATPLELSDDARESYATERHGSLQNFEALLVQLMGILTRKSLAAYKGNPYDGFRLEAPEIVVPGQELEITAATDGPAIRIAAALENVDTGAKQEVLAEIGDDGRATATFPGQPAGVYRVTVRDPDGTGLKPVSDLLVAGDDASAEEELEKAEAA
jgi:pimeloyl-ACP methyl ester carboxylesterase